MGVVKKNTVLLSAFLWFVLAAAVSASTSKNYSLRVSAQVERSPAKIILSWETELSYTGSYLVYKKALEETAWGEPIGRTQPGETGFTDDGADYGMAYDYKIVMESGPLVSGYIYAGIDVPAAEDRGKVVLIAERSLLPALEGKIRRLEDDLFKAGWTVLRHDVSRNDKPADVKALIKTAYAEDPAGVKSVFLLGHIPVFSSREMNPDGHEPRPFPADSYYGDMDGDWETQPPATLPGDVELAVGRVDMWSLPAFAPLTETDLVERYLDKNHAFRMGQRNLRRRGFIHDDFPGLTAAKTAWAGFLQLSAPGQEVTEGVWKNTLTENDYLLSFICGGGTDISISTHALMTNDLVANRYKTHFSFFFGSYFGKWDTRDNLMRAFLAMPEYGLTNGWGARPQWILHHMGLNEPIGTSARLTQNGDNSVYDISGATGLRSVHAALLGDPTLTLYPVLPPSNVRLTLSANRNNRLDWEPAGQPGAQYHLYRKDAPDGAYRRITPQPVDGTSFVDMQSAAHDARYLVKTVVLEETASGTFYNLSQGAVSETVSSDSAAAVYHPDNRQIGISGYISRGSGRQVTVMVTDEKNRIVALNQTVSGENGRFGIDCAVKNISGGRYRVFIGHEGTEKPAGYGLDIDALLLVKVTGRAFTDEDGIAADALTDNARLRFAVQASNESRDSVTLTVLLAYYNKSGALVKTASAPLKIAGGKTGGAAPVISLPEKAAEGYVKGFLWHDTEGLQPLCEVMALGNI